MNTVVGFAALSVTLGFALIANAFALEPATLLSQYGHISWTIQDGYFKGAPTAFAQSGDGYLWIGTRAGLLQFDGVRFTPFSVSAGEPLRNTSIWSLFRDRAGTLWIGTRTGLAHLQDGRLTQYPLKYSKSAFGRINTIMQARDGAIWFVRDQYPGMGRDGPVCTVMGLDLRCYNGADGSFWLSDDSSLYHWNPMNHRTLRGGIKDIGGPDGFEAMTIDADGSVLMGMMGNPIGLAHDRDGRLEPF